MTTLAADITAASSRTGGYTCTIRAFCGEIAKVSGKTQNFQTIAEAKAWGVDRVSEILASLGLKADVKVGADRDDKFFAKVFV